MMTCSDRFQGNLSAFSTDEIAMIQVGAGGKRLHSIIQKAQICRPGAKIVPLRTFALAIIDLIAKFDYR
jgi:hypothetical protein